MWRRLQYSLALLLTVLSAPGIGQVASVQTSSRVLEFEPNKFLSKNTVEEISKLPTDVVRTLDSTNDILDMIRQRCGWLDPAFLDQFAKLNNIRQINDDTLKGLTGTEVKFPACVKVSPSGALVKSVAEGNLTNFVPSDDLRDGIETQRNKLTAALKNAATQVNTKTGDQPIQGNDSSVAPPSDEKGKAFDLANKILGGTIPLAKIDQDRGVLFSNSIYDLAMRIVGDLGTAVSVVKESDQSQVTTIPLRMQTPSAQVGQVVAAATASGEVQASAPVPALIAPVSDNAKFSDPALLSPLAEKDVLQDCNEGRVAPNASANTGNPTQWPLKLGTILDTLLLNAFERERRGRSQNFATILVADTGFPLAQFTEAAASARIDNTIEPRQFFSRQDFFVNEGEMGKDPDAKPDQDGDGFDDNVYGISLQKLNGDITPAASYQFKDHGMSVASLAIGGIQMSRYRMLRTLPLRLHFANLTDETNPSRVQLTNKELSLLVDYTRPHKIDIVNMSITSDKRLLDLEKAVKRSDDTLFIVAAGNDGQPLDGMPRWPANLGGNDNTEGGIVITVAAHREDGRILRFSNYSKVFVDIAAPGCNMPVPVIVQDNGTARLKLERQHGTSFAAPIVSFVAGLLRSEGFKAYDIKRRLILSAEHDTAIENKVQYGARLDPAAALSIYDDIIDLWSPNGKGERIRGRLKRGNVLSVCSGDRLVKDFYRIDMVSRQGTRSTYQEFFDERRPGENKFRVSDRCTLDDQQVQSQSLSFYDVDAFEEKNIPLNQVKTVIMRER